MPSCDQLTALVTVVKDPLWHLQTDGTAGPAWQKYIGPAGGGGASTTVGFQLEPVDYAVHFGPAALPRRRPVSRGFYTNIDEVMVALRLLQTYYETPNDLRLCPAAQGWYHVSGRVRALDALATYGASPGFVRGGPAAVGQMLYVLLRIFGDPRGSKSGDRETEVVAAAANLVLKSNTGTFDSAVWLPLWGWANGGAYGNASVRTRVFAMKALQAILRRDRLLPGQVRAADTAAAILQQLVAGRAPSIPVTERELFLSEAAALVGAVASAMINDEMSASNGGLPAPAPPATPVWVWPTVAAGAGLLAVGGAVLVVATRRRAAV